MTAWDFRSFLRALAATLLGLTIVWLVTAASDEGDLAIGVRAGRTLPLAPFAGGIGLAIASVRAREETLALEALGRSPAESMVAAVIGAALPSVVIAAALAAGPTDVAAFYPRAPIGDTFVARDGAFESASLGVRIDPDGEIRPLSQEAAARGRSEDLPRGARGAASAATALAGIALPLAAARATGHTSLLDCSKRRRRTASVVAVVLTSLCTLVAFQAAAARLAPAWLAAIPPALLLGSTLFAMR